MTTLQNTPYRHDNYDRAYANGDFIANAETYPAKWLAEAAAFRASLGERAVLDLPYGDKERNRYDLFLPTTKGMADTRPKGTLVFIHGGYWRAFAKESFSHLATGAVANGWACVVPSYTLAPDATITEITQEMAELVTVLANKLAGDIVVTGHSAGGHLAARMAAVDSPLATDIAARVTKVVPISPLSDLQPLLGTELNKSLQMDQAEAIKESPANDRLRSACKAHIWVGAQERPSFLWQARLLSEQWSCPWTAAANKHHFDVIDDLVNPDSELVQVCLGNSD